MNMLLWTNHVTNDHIPLIDTIKEIGYDGIEIPLGEGDSKHYSMLGKVLSEMGIKTTAVTSLLENTNIASPHKSIRAAGLERIKWAIDMASEIKAELICGPIHSAFAYFTGVPPTESELKWSVENLQKAGEYAAKSNVILAPEALNRFECYLVNTMTDLGKLLDDVNHPNVGAIYDTHHANIEEKNQGKAIQEISRHLKHVHISENDRGTPGAGQVNWDEVFSELARINYQGWVTIEAFSRAVPEFSNAINVWREFSPPDEICRNGFDFVTKMIKNRK